MRALRLMAILMVMAHVLTGVATATQGASLLKTAQSVFAPLPDKPVFKKDNPGLAAKLQLGKMLFFDTRLSKSNVYSCNSCHNLSTGGVDNNSFSTGHKWEAGGRNSPTVLNAALQIAQFWDGRAEDVEAQAQGPILNPIEMAASRDLALARIKSIPEYVAIFKEAFPGQKDPVTYKNLADAIGAFERTLLTPSRFDTFLKGDEKALNTKEKAGLTLFMDKGCANCHSGILLGGSSYQKFGLVNKPEGLKDKGRMDVTKKDEDMNVFKVPTLRNIALTYPYFNDGSVWGLKETISTMGWTQLGEKLPEDDLDKLAAFLNSLTGRQPEVTIPILPPSTSATPCLA